MELNKGEGYQDGKTYICKLKEVRQFCDTKYQSDEIEPKLQFVYEGKHGAITETTGLPVVDGKPEFRPNVRFTKRLAAFGYPFDKIKSIKIPPIQDKLADIYQDWTDFPRFADAKQEGFTPITVDILVNGKSILGSECQISVELDKDGFAKPNTVVAVAE